MKTSSSAHARPERIILLTTSKTSAHARAHQYAVPAFDCVEDVMVRAILETAEELRSPVILMGLPPDLKGNGMAYVSGLVRAVADHHSIPVALHLDHATDLHAGPGGDRSGIHVGDGGRFEPAVCGERGVHAPSGRHGACARDQRGRGAGARGRHGPGGRPRAASRC